MRLSAVKCGRGYDLGFLWEGISVKSWCLFSCGELENVSRQGTGEGEWFCMKLIQKYLTKSGCYRAGRKIAVRGLMIHSVGCPQPKASAFISNWDKAHAGACVHAIVEPGGDVYQLLPWDYRGWHCGGDANGTHIGVEMTEPATIRYTGGSDWAETGDGRNTESHVLAAYKYAVELFAYLCRMYGLDPLADGVVISHSEGCKRGIASNHGDVEHIWKRFGLSMGQFRKDIRAAMDGSETGSGGDGGSGVSGFTGIMGKAAATAEQMREYVKRKNPDAAQSVLDMVPLYLSEGETEGVRGDVAFAQSCLETGNFTFSGSAVTLEQNNFAGMGVTQNGVKGLSFDTAQLGIRCQVQHLKAYACTEALVNENIDPRFKYVVRGCAPYVEWLGIRENPQGKGWAAGAGYGEKILSILKEITGEAGSAGDGADSPDNPVQPMSGYVKVFYKGRDGVNVRTAPCMGDNVDQVVYEGIYTVTGISGDKRWYRLKSGLFITADAEYVMFMERLPGKSSYLVRVDIPDLNIRKGPGTDFARTGLFTGIGTFTIVEEADGKGAGKWGLLKSYKRERNGWISLDFVTRL